MENIRHCIICGVVISARKYCQNHSETNKKEYNKRYHKTYKRKFSEEYMEHQRRMARTYHHHNKDIIKVKRKARYNKNKLPPKPKRTIEEKRKTKAEAAKRYRKKTNYYHYYYKKNPSHKISQLFRQRLWRLLNGIRVEFTMEEIIGCTKEYLKHYIESNFKPGMNWGNHTRDGWHIDHIIPCAYFDLTNPQELKKCFHYTNLSPLWAKENMQKGKKICKFIELSYVCAMSNELKHNHQ